MSGTLADAMKAFLTDGGICTRYGLAGASARRDELFRFRALTRPAAGPADTAWVDGTAADAG